MYHKDTKSRQVYDENTDATLVILGRRVSVLVLQCLLCISGKRFLSIKNRLFLFICNDEKKEKLERFLSSLGTGRTL